MLFNSFVFLFGFLPLALALTYALGRYRQTAAKLALTLLSLGFYAWWRPSHLPLLMGSIVFNYLVGARIQRAHALGEERPVRRWLVLGLLVDIGLLGWFKYANFVADVAGFELEKIALPLAISFFTFQKIAYLIDSARGEAKPMSFLDFSLFAAFFPQLIAGPIVHYKEVVPQLTSPLFGRLIWRNLTVGTVIFAIGLFKKTVIADTLAAFVPELFSAAAAPGAGLVAGWLAAITFTLQLYFDFSGYSDMAIGLGRMFGVKLPLNFHSPLRATNIIDYWRRWHMTLQRFIVAYIYQPLALPLNRFAAERGLSGWTLFVVGLAIPSFVTFVAIGIWHGAGWTFIAFGVMHATYICINEAWRERRKLKKRRLKKAGVKLADPAGLEVAGYHLLTLVAVMLGNVMFRADSVGDAMSIWAAMVRPVADLAVPGLGAELLATIAIAALIVALAPNTQQIMRRYDPAHNWRDWADVAPSWLDWNWTPSPLGILLAGLTLSIAIGFIQRGGAVFLYFNF
jgi:D-alanyl-lipoteichoic acid acyltransferase DltB (MBOAT superfamily)